MLRRVLLVLCVPTVAHADDRLDLEPIPELAGMESLFELDRYTHDPADWCGTGHWGHAWSFGVGAARSRDHDGEALVGSFAAGTGHALPVLFAVSGNVAATDRAIERMAHHALLEYRTTSDHDRGSGVVVESTGEYGTARGLAPARLGGGRRATEDARAEALLQLGREHDDFIWTADVEGGAGTTRWFDQPFLDHAVRRSLALGFSRAPADGEMPRGTLDVFRGKVEQVRITRAAAVAAGGTAPLHDTDVRIVELGLGARELTFHVDREVLAVIVGDLGWTWLEADADAGAIARDMFRMRLATAATWVSGRVQTARRHVGVAVAREPSYAADGQRLVSDWRVEVESGIETPGLVASASGGVSWLTPVAGGAPADTTVLRYGSHLEGFVKIACGLELGGYHAVAYEPAHAWHAPRAWSTEAGVLLRLRSR